MGCISLLKFDLKYVQNKKYISEIMPDLFENIDDYIGKKTYPYNYTLPKELIEIQEKIASNLKLQKNLDNQFEL
jgi:hypothetical protein